MTIRGALSAIGAGAAALLLGCAGAAFAQTTAFTYQGKLTDAGNPANGDFDLQFRLYDTATTGTGVQQGATAVRTPVAVTAGIFTVTLDFGASVFGGADRFLDIGVRPAGDSAPYTSLAPRQPITASPYAIQTLNAQQLGGLPASGFIQNTGSPQAGATFNIGGKGTAGSLDVGGPITAAGVAAPAVAPAGQGRIYFDAAANKVKVSENGGAFVNLVGATGVSGSGTVNSLPVWSAGTTLGSSLISQNGTTVFLPSSVITAPTASTYQIAFGSPNFETGITFSSTSGSGRADLRFDGTTAKLVAGPVGSPPLATNGVAVNTSGNVLVGATIATGKLSVQTADPVQPAIYGESAIRGVWGKSSTGSGVYGQTGASSATDAGVRGNATAAGGIGMMGTGTTGVYGLSTSSDGIGVTGQSNTGAATGVYGSSSSTTGKGVLGEATGTAGYGVYARSLTGNALGVEGNAVQARANSGLVKAMLYVNADGTIQRCFNAYLPGAAATTGNCGFSITHTIGGPTDGIYYVNLGFKVDDRFVSITPYNSVYVNLAGTFGLSGNVVSVYINITDVNQIDSSAGNPFMLIVF